MKDDFESRLNRVRRGISEACSRSRRDEKDIALLAVSKKQDPASVDVAAGFGLTLMGESRIQEAKAKIPLCSDGLEWHLVGHLQSNKVKDAVRLFSMIHSVDSEKILQCVNDECAAVGKVMPVCLEVNVSGEGSKYGFAPQDIVGMLGECESLMNVDVVGLMTIPPVTSEPEGARPYFEKLRQLRDKCSAETAFPLPELSMGMSVDFEVAIEEGATIIRLGTILFGGRS